MSIVAIAPEAGEKILDLGYSTVGLSIALASAEPKANVTGYDIDPEVLEIARNQIARQNGVFQEVNVTDTVSLPQQDIDRFD